MGGAEAAGGNAQGGDGGAMLRKPAVEGDDARADAPRDTAEGNRGSEV